MLYSSFEKPDYNKNVYVKNEQHYAACTWRDKTWILTDQGKHIRGKWFALLISIDGYGVLSNTDGDFAGAPFKLPDGKFVEIAGRAPQTSA